MDKDRGSHGIAAGFDRVGTLPPSACDIGFIARQSGSVEEMIDSTNATTGSSSNLGYGTQSRMPPPGPFDPYMPDTSIGLSPQVSRQSPPILTPGSTSNSESNNAGQNVHGSNRTASYSEQRTALAEYSPSFMYDAAATQPSMIGEFPSSATWQQGSKSTSTRNLNTNNPAKAFTDMDVLFDLPTPSEFDNGLGNTGMTPGVQDFTTMTFGQQTTMPVRNNGDAATSTNTPGSWNLTGGTGMTPNFNDLSGAADWDNLMDGLADWDPSQMNDGLIPSLD